MGSDSATLWLRALAVAMLVTIGAAVAWRVPTGRSARAGTPLEHVVQGRAQADG
jgi:hypothetical protein